MHISRGKSKYGKGPKDNISRVKKSTTSGVSRDEIGILLENFKIDILSTLGSQLGTLKIKQKKEEENSTLIFFSPKCRKRHPLIKCPLDNIEICGVCEKHHAT
jgi:hypothetical protein